ncbi:MAG: hypothetical protein R3F17_10175 [Planctomycetota bacterium]
MLSLTGTLADEKFGNHLSMHGNRLLVGKDRANSNLAGHAFVYERHGGSWGFVRASHRCRGIRPITSGDRLP